MLESNQYGIRNKNILTWRSLFPVMQPKSSLICAAVEMIICHLLLVIYHRLEPQPTRHTTIIGTEIHHDNFRYFDQPVQHDKRDFLTKTTRLSTKLAIGHLLRCETKIIHTKPVIIRSIERNKRNTHTQHKLNHLNNDHSVEYF